MQYKIIAKFIETHISCEGNNVICVKKSTFVKGQQIFDSPIMVNEILNYYMKMKEK